MSESAGVYIHIPFCASRCHYCNFATGGYEAELARRYVAALSAEIERASAAAVAAPDRMRSVDTIYFGGGTPTTLTVEQLSSLIELCRREFEVAPGAEITAEVGGTPEGRRKQLTRALDRVSQQSHLDDVGA